MYLKEKSNYIKGLVNMASHNMGPSYMTATCYDNFTSFQKDYKIPSSISELEEIKKTPSEFFQEILKIEGRELDTLLHWFRMRCGDILKISTSKNEKLLDHIMKKKYSPFFFLEEMYFLDFKDITIILMIGNDE